MAAASGSRHLLRVLGTAFGVAAIIGGTIGQGIMRTPGIVAQEVPRADLILLLWLAGGALAWIDAMSSMELAASVRLSGGPYIFARRAFGRFIGLAVGVTDWLGNVAAIAYIAVVFAEYLHRLGIGTALPIGVVAPMLPLATGIIHWFGTRVGGASQEVGSAVKALIYCGLIVLLLAVPHGPAPDAAAASPVAPIGWMAIIIAMRAIVTTYTGWNAAIYYSEEMRDPRKAIVSATRTGILLVTAVYVLMNAALLRTLSPAEMAGSTLVAADAAERAFGGSSGAADLLVTIVSLVSVATIANSMLMQFPRVLYAIARDEDASALSSVAENGTPRLALVLTAAVAALLATVGVYDLLIAFSASLLTAMGLSVNVAAIVLRWREPELERPYRMPLFPLPAFAALALNGLLLAGFIIEDTRTSAAAFGLLLLLTLGLHLHRRRAVARPAATDAP
ncbi:MAG: hypothetical protein DI547_02465 [Sphingobium sp.]|jgi:APA family basic amino acid/polyamine antiporter|nr:MAG: hypothetical protein DI547_02465 [Sphingobium sp.]